MSIPDRIAILNTDGTTDTSFAVGEGLDDTGFAISALSTGQIVVGGQFLYVGANIKARLAVLNADGTLVPDVPTPSAAVNTLALQTDGSVVFGGDFTTVSGTTRNRLARLLPDLTLEAAFNPNVNGVVRALALQTDGKILAGGQFSTVGSTTRNNVARLYNGTAANSLYAVNADLIKWDRTGTSEETQRVEFEIDTGSGYGPLAGVISRTSSGWQIIPTVSLSGSTNDLRATAFPSDSHSEGIQQATASAPILPEIEVEIDGVILTSGVGTIYFPSTQVGSNSSKTVTVRNIGLASLTLDATPVTFSPTGQYDVVTQPSSPVLPGQSVTFTVNLTPTSAGTKTTTMTIHSDDGDEASFTVAFSGAATPGPGSQDSSWQPTANGYVTAISERATGVIGLAGDFTTLGTQTRNRYAFVDSVGTVQAQTGAGVNGFVHCMAQLPDGKALIGGQFTSQYIRRLNTDGSLDGTFTLITNGEVRCMALLPNGSVLIGGSFTNVTLGTINSRQYLARLDFSSTGVVSLNAFSTTCNSNILSIAVQTDGKIIVGGNFTTIAGSTQSYLARLNADGSIDSTFSAGLTSRGFVQAIDASGRVLLGGSGTSIGGVDKRGVLRLTSTGAIDGTFSLVGSCAESLVPQTDGTLLIGASLASPALASQVSRALTSGADDTTFVSGVVGTASAIYVLESGQILVGGQFQISGGPMTYAAKLINGTAATALSVVSQTAVQWLRSGTLPETQITVFDLSQDGGTTWTRLGQGTRISGGWTLTGISLPTNGTLRARAYIQCGYLSGSVSIQEDQLTFSGVLAPDLMLQVADGSSIPADGLTGYFPVSDDGSTRYFTAIGGAFIDILVKLTNAGTATLSSIAATLTGWSTEFSIASSPPTSISAGNSDTMVVRFSPATGAKGYRNPTLNIASNNPGTKSTYTIQVNTAAVAVPAATTGVASAIGGGSATLAGTFTPNHIAATCYFQYKLVASSTWLTSSTNTVAGFSPTPSTKVISGLTVGQNYHFRAVVYNSINTITSIPTTGTTSTDPWIGAVVAFTA
jgi:uncharacterized delta-60 repeat protein